ncbi:MAG: TraR/DksA C4-type zinc finger protein [bacterium]|nr:TraR/DksA C4-type zinc finger protein [bacterium]
MLSTEFLSSVKESLLQTKTRLEKDLSNVGRKHGDHFEVSWEDHGSGEEENASEVATFGDSFGVGYALNTELKEVNAALGRLESGTYGICENCKQEIDEKRLAVRPMSTHCVECLKKEEGFRV